MLKMCTSKKKEKGTSFQKGRHPQKFNSLILQVFSYKVVYLTNIQSIKVVGNFWF